MIKILTIHVNDPNVSYCLARTPQFIFHNGSVLYPVHFVESNYGDTGSSSMHDKRTLSEFLKERD